MPLQYVKSQKGFDKLVDSGFMFVKDKTLANGVKTWGCDGLKKFGCKARVNTNGENVVHRSGQHHHTPSQIQISAKEVLADLKNRAATTQDQPRAILAKGVKNVSAAVSAVLPGENAMKRAVQRKRKRDVNAPVNPASRQDLVITDQFEMTHQGTQFLQYDSGPDDNRILIFSSPNGIINLSQSEKWLCDGTFSVCPTIFFQLYTVHAIVGDIVLPCAYALLPDKSEETYSRFFEALKELPGDDAFNPAWVLTDFEKASLNAVGRHFPNAEITGCFFHMTQAVWRKIQEHGLATRYTNDEGFNITCRSFPALAFVPVDRVLDAYIELDASIKGVEREQLQPILQYFEYTFIGRTTVSGRRRPPLFAIHLWNQYENTVANNPRTNNAVEGWHRAFQGSVACNKPTIWKLIDTLKDEESLVQFRLNQQAAGHRPPLQRKEYEIFNDKIFRQIENCPEDNFVAYLRDVATNVSV